MMIYIIGIYKIKSNYLFITEIQFELPCVVLKKEKPHEM